MTHPNLTIVAAVGLDGEIGRAGGLPWPRIAADMRRFRELTTARLVVAGRLTAASFPGGKLAGRTVCVLSRTLPMSGEPTLAIMRSLDDFMIYAGPGREVRAVGGVEVFREALPLASTFHLTRVLARYPDADTYFPTWPFPVIGDGWRLTDTETAKAFGEPGVVMETYRK